MLADTQFSTTPHGTMDYVLSMDKAKTIKVTPTKWPDMFVSAFLGCKGN